MVLLQKMAIGNIVTFLSDFVSKNVTTTMTLPSSMVVVL
jgi:hypothetical protein